MRVASVSEPATQLAALTAGAGSSVVTRRVRMPIEPAGRMSLSSELPIIRHACGATPAAAAARRNIAGCGLRKPVSAEDTTARIHSAIPTLSGDLRDTAQRGPAGPALRGRCPGIRDRLRRPLTAQQAWRRGRLKVMRAASRGSRIGQTGLLQRILCAKLI
jgi:hypothetical protein